MSNTKINLSEINVTFVKPNNGLIGFANCLVNQAISLNNIAIYSRPEGGYRLVYPGKTLANGQVLNYFYPMNREAGDLFEKNISEKVYELQKNILRPTRP